MVREHVRDQRAGGVEVEDRLERRGVGEQGVVSRYCLDQQQDGRRDAEHHAKPGRGAGAAYRQHHETQDGDPEDTEQRTTNVARLHERVEQHCSQLSGEQDRRGLSPGKVQHAAKLVPGPVANHMGRPRRAILPP